MKEGGRGVRVGDRFTGNTLLTENRKRHHHVPKKTGNVERQQ